MVRKTIAMPDEMGSWVTRRMQSGQYNNESEYFRDLVRRDQERETAALQLRQLLEEGEASGVSRKKVPGIMKDVEDRLRKDGRLRTH